MNLIDNAGGIQNIEKEDFERFVTGTFELADGTTFKLDADARERLYKLRESFINGAMSTYNDMKYVQEIYNRISLDPMDQSILIDIESEIGDEITVAMYRTIKSDLKTAQENKDHIFIQNKEFQDLYTLIDDGITGYRSFVTSDQVGILPLLVNEAQTRLHRKAMIMLKSTKDDGTPMYSQAQFQNEMRQSAIRFIINSVALINAGGDQAV